MELSKRVVDLVKTVLRPWADNGQVSADELAEIVQRLKARTEEAAEAKAEAKAAERELLTRREAMALLHVKHKATLLAWERVGSLKALRINVGRRQSIRYTRAAVMAALQSGTSEI